MVSMNQTSINSSNTTFDSTTWLLQLSFWPIRIICPLLVILCPIANWICIRVFQSRIYSRASSKWYFISIAIFDTIYVLITAPLIFFITFEIYILNWHIIFCKLIVFLNYLSCQISAGLLACLSVDRLVATTCSFLYRRSCTTGISKYVCLFVILILSLVNSHYLIGYALDSNGHCSARYYKWYGDIYSHLNVVYLLSYSIIPFTIITICNLFIAISVYQNKSNMERKYIVRKRILSYADPIEHPVIISPHFGLSAIHEEPLEIVDNQKDEKLAQDTNEKQIIDRNCKYPIENHLAQKLLSDGEELVNPVESSTRRKTSSNAIIYHKQSSSNRVSSSFSSTYSHRMCVQLQITLSLLTISISFIFCTLPNCLSTIMIQNYVHNNEIRKVWQAINYLSIVPLLITHSVNLIFYYSSSSMFRNHLKEIYISKTSSTKNCLL